MKTNTILTSATAVLLLNLLLFACALSQEDSIETLLIMAEQGDAAAQYDLAKAYEEGGEVEQDIAIAAEWYRKSAEQDYVDAQFVLLGMFPWETTVSGNFTEEEARQRQRLIEESPISQREAVQWGVRAARLGHTGAQARVGLLRLSIPHHVRSRLEPAEITWEDAKKFLHAAGEQGELTALYALYWLYGVDTSDVLASRKWSRLYVEQSGRISAMWGLAQHYSASDEDNPPDYVESYIWYSLGGSSKEAEEVKQHLTPDEIAYADEEIIRRREEIARRTEAQEINP